MAWLAVDKNGGEWIFDDKFSAITEVSISSIRLGVTWFCTKEMFQYSTFLDGSPFGVKVEDKEE